MLHDRPDDEADDEAPDRVAPRSRIAAHPRLSMGSMHVRPTSTERRAAQAMRGVPRATQGALSLRVRAGAAACVVFLAACANWPAQDDVPDAGELLQNSLPVAAAALAAGQLDVARRLYLSLTERFDHAPEPFLGLGYIALQSDDFPAAEKYFLQAASRATDQPTLQAEALLGAGRTALVRGRTQAAREHFRGAQAPGRDTPMAAWIANGLAVTFVLDADHGRAETHYSEALRLSSDNPRIAANYIRTLVAAGRADDAVRAFARYPPSHWPEDDATSLSGLIDEARRQRRVQALAGTRTTGPAAAAAETGAREDAASVRTERGEPSLRTSGATPVRPDQEVPGLAPPHPRDPDLAMRLYLSSTLPAPASGDPHLEADATPPERSALMLHLGDWPGPERAPAPGPTPPRSDAAASAPAVRQTHAVASAPGAAGTPSEPTAPAPAPSGPAQPVASSPPAATVSGTTRPHPLPEHEAPALAVPDSSLPTTLTLTVGQSRRLHLDHDATTVLVASPEVADVRLLAPNVLYVIGKGVGRTSVAVLDDRERVEERIVSVVLDLEPLRTILAGEPDLRGVRAQRLSRGVALTGEVDSAAAADRALRVAARALPEGVSIENELHVAGPQQVNLEVQMAEVHRSVSEELGVSWEAIRTLDSQDFGFRIGRAITDSFGEIIPATFDGSPASSLFLTRVSSRSRFQAMIDALATAGLANVLARPNVTAVSGESASFFSGGEYPLPTGFEDGVIIFEYKKYGVLLDFVPTVVDTGRIILTVRPEVSEPSLNQAVQIVGIDVPVINVRRAETTVEVGDGESIVIAGLFRNASNTVESGVPGLKDVPLLGALFGHTSTRSDELELIVIVTARLVQAGALSNGPANAPESTTTLRVSGYHY